MGRESAMQVDGDPLHAPDVREGLIRDRE
jgi:hypothetical protein